MNRRGFTLFELLLGLVLLGIFAMSLVSVVRVAGKEAARATTALLADRALRTLEIFAQQELRDAANTDVAALSATKVSLSRPIGEAIPCLDSGGVVLISDVAWTGTRPPEGARDDAWLLVDPLTATWLRIAVDSVGRGRCPLGGAPAARLSVAPHAGVAAVVRVMEPVELSAYRSGSSDWFGLTPANHLSAVQPFAGPLVPGTARFAWFSNHLDIAVPAQGSTPTTVQVPFGPPP